MTFNKDQEANGTLQVENNVKIPFLPIDKGYENGMLGQAFDEPDGAESNHEKPIIQAPNGEDSDQKLQAPDEDKFREEQSAGEKPDNKEPNKQEPIPNERPEAEPKPEEEPIPETPNTPNPNPLESEDPDPDTETPGQPNPEEPGGNLQEGDHVVKERQWLEPKIIILSTEPIYSGHEGEEVIDGATTNETTTTSRQEPFPDEIITEIVIETQMQTVIEEVLETRIELVPEIVVIQEEQQVQVGTDEEGNPIFEKHFVDVETEVIREVEREELVERKVDVEVEVEVEQEVTVPGGVRVIDEAIEMTTKVFDQIVQYDPTLDEGQEKIIQAGVNGVSQTTTTTTTENGEVVSTTTEARLISEHVPEIKSVGTRKVVGEKVVQEEVAEQIFAKIVRYDASQYEDYNQVIQAGVNGNRRVVVEVLTNENGETRSVISEEGQATQDQISLVGTKPIQSTGTSATTVVIPYETKVQYVDSEGAFTRVLTPGMVGVRTKHFEIIYEKGIEVSRILVDSRMTQEPVAEVVEVGRANIAYETRTETAVIDFNIVESKVATLPVGERRVVQKGVAGQETITYQDKLVEGVVVESSEVRRQMIKDPVDEIVEVGTAVKEEIRIEEITETTQLAFEMVEKRIDSEETYRRVVQEGQPGQLETVYQVTYRNGIEVNRQVVRETVTQEPVDAIVEVGLGNLKNTDSFKDQIETEFLRLINQERRVNGLYELATSLEIKAGTDLRAQEIQAKFAHERPDGRDFYTAFGIPHGQNYYLGENIAQNNAYPLESASNLAAKMFTQFKESPGHYLNMLNPDYTKHNFSVTRVPGNQNSYAYYGAHILQVKPLPN